MGIYLIRGLFVVLSTFAGMYCFPEHKAIGVTTGFLVSIFIIGLEMGLGKIPLKKLILAVVGLIVGLITAILVANFLLLIPFEDPKQAQLLRFALYFIFSYLGIITAIRGVGELGFFLPYLHEMGEDEQLVAIDTSVLIDGRVYEIAKSGFLDYTIIIPKFVIQELHGLADSSSDMKRQRGRRGLEIMNKMRKDNDLDVKVYDMDFPQIAEVDAKLVRLASTVHAKLLTNDFNLSKVAEVQSIKVLNLNTLATLMRPRLMSGEEVSLKIAKEGKEASQGVGYLEDGTMIVVENGARHVGRVVSITIDSAIQTSTGRIIFAKLK